MVHRRDIEGLRSIAVLAVVAFHYGVPGVRGGFVGVDIFFVISGYLITGLLVAELNNTGRIDLPRFYGRRARRLLPASLLVTVVTLGGCMLIFSPIEQKVLAKAAFAASAYLSNVWFLYSASGYFSPESTLNPFLHTWSLSVEEQFYLFWPALLLIGRPLKLIRIATVMALVTIVSFAACIWLTAVREPWAFYSLPTRAWEFGMGGLASLIPVRWVDSRVWRAIGWTGMSILLGTCFISYDASRFPGPGALVPVVASVAVLASGAGQDRLGPIWLLGTRPFQWVGVRSYSIYLWHWPIIVLASAVLTYVSPTLHFGCFLLTLLCSTATYRFVENPIRQNPWFSARALRSLGLGALLTCFGIAFAFGSALIARRLATTSFQSMIDDSLKQEPVASGADGGCLVGFTDWRPVSCTFGTPISSRVVVLFGDSHADQWSTPISGIATRHGWRLITILKSACSVAAIPVYNIRLHRFSPECAQWRISALEEIIQLRPVAVIVAEFSSNYIRGAQTSLGENATEFETWEGGFARTIEGLHAAGIPVVLLRDSPTPGRDMANCLARADWHRQVPTICDLRRLDVLDERVTRTERRLSEQMSSVAFVDLTSEFCDSSTCPAILDGVPVYRDPHHLTVAYAAHLAGPLESELGPFIDAH
jgi:peptidoglycan/LPS O-acetylase OafA/YrhL